MVADFVNMGYEALPKTVSRLKMAAELDKSVPEALQLISEFKWLPISNM